MDLWYGEERPVISRICYGSANERWDIDLGNISRNTACFDNTDCQIIIFAQPLSYARLIQ